MIELTSVDVSYPSKYIGLPCEERYTNEDHHHYSSQYDFVFRLTLPFTSNISISHQMW